MNLRPYQFDGVDAVFDEWTRVAATILHQATGTGKTVEIAEIVRRAQPKRALILAHRRVLIQQAHDKIEAFGGLNAEIEMGEERASYDLFGECHAVVSSVQSQTPGRRSRPTDFDILVVDEMHHCKPGNRSYADVIAHYKQNPNLKILGVTATLEAGWKPMFDTVAFTYDLHHAINDGYLVNIEQQMVTVHGLDYSHIRTTAGDLNGAELDAVVRNEKVCQGMIMGTLETMFGIEQHSLSSLPVERWAEVLFANGRPRRNLVFTVSVAQAKMMSDIFNRVRPGLSAWVCGDVNLVSEDQRRQIGRDFNNGTLLIVCNCGIYSEGYDSPGIEMVTMARPTKSRTLFTQQIGRGTRTLEGIIDGVESTEGRHAAIAASRKPNLLVLDFVGNCGRHKLITSADILGDEFSEEVRERVKKITEQSNKPQNVSALLQQTLEQMALEKAEREREEQARRARLVAATTYSKTIISPFDQFNVRHERPTAWDRQNGRVFSPGQRGVLLKMGVLPDDVSFTCGKKLIGAWFNQPATPPQARVLKRAGYPDGEISNMTKMEASKVITKLANNGWRRPSPILDDSPPAEEEVPF